MGAYSYLNGKKIKFWKIKVLSNDELEKDYPEIKEYEYRLPGLESGTVLLSDSKKDYI